MRANIQAKGVPGLPLKNPNFFKKPESIPK